MAEPRGPRPPVGLGLEAGVRTAFGRIGGEMAAKKQSRWAVNYTAEAADATVTEGHFLATRELPTPPLPAASCLSQRPFYASSDGRVDGRTDGLTEQLSLPVSHSITEDLESRGPLTTCRSVGRGSVFGPKAEQTEKVGQSTIIKYQSMTTYSFCLR